MRLFHVICLTAIVCCASASRQDFLTKFFNECIGADSWSSCLKHEVLSYLDEKLGTITEARSLETVDEALVVRSVKYLKSFDYGIDLPFVDAKLKYRPSRSLADLDVEFKNSEAATSQARGLLKKKLLLPFLVLLKLKMKALMPIFVALIGLKAMKALILSKVALLVVVAFVALQFFKKGGMAPPTGMSMEPAPAGAYGAPPVPTTTSGYEPINTWDGNGPYSRVWTPSDAQGLAYNYYSPSSSSGSSANSYGAPSVSSSSSSSSSSGSY
ncbi:uncharacterized protein LOC107045913 [Diachasma alloeum]|uniref:uncharacterized protein LOC107045913 n=1 Tax=Diachasma alloeum TaxID=454923 RepID=UPI0007382BC5|nr:uncharacterized protein LOC107045913 [Diachasma alloeum]